MSEYNRLVLEASNQRRRAAEVTNSLQKVLAAVDQGLTLGDVNWAVELIENLHERDRRHTEAKVKLGAYPFHVYPGSEKLDLGVKGEPVVLCQSENQAKHMAQFWGSAGYYEEAQAMAPAPCPKCDGCGQVANTPDQEPWSVWMALPLKSCGAVVVGFVKPIPCPQCGVEEEEAKHE